MRWYNNAVVSVASNCELSSTTKLVSRWSREQKRRIDVPMPQMIHCYNRFMGGVDLIDLFIANYRIRIRSKKWWWPFFSWSVDACLVNAWLMYKSVKKELNITFRFSTRSSTASIEAAWDSKTQIRTKSHLSPHYDKCYTF